jgi:hypothetical protein
MRRQGILQTLEGFLNAGAAADGNGNVFADLVGECGGFEILEKWKVEGTEAEQAMIGVLFEALC